MTATPILETLAHEFSASVEHVSGALEMVDAGLSAPFVGRFRRGQVGGMSESVLRRLDRRRAELEDLDRRRGTILRLLERETGVPAGTLDAIRGCMDRFELEDLFIPHRRPEPEVQLALDRGLGALADLLVAPLARPGRADKPAEEEADDDEDEPEPAPRAAHDAPAASVPAAPEAPSEPAPAVIEAPPADGAPPGEDARAGEETEGEAAGGPAASAPQAAEEPGGEPPTQRPHLDVRAAMNAQLARLCAPFVNPDRGIHTESEALSGALRILSDRLGRDARLRGTVRRLLRKHGVLTVRPTIDESKAGRWKPLLRVRQPLRQVQGHRLLGIRQAQKERVLTTHITLDPAKVLPKVRAALGKHTHEAHAHVLDEVALQALNDRLLPMVEQDVRLELKERADAEALRFLAQHLRQILLAPCLGRRPVLGIDVNARGDWTLSLVETGGAPRAPVPDHPDKVEVGEKDAAALGAEIKAWLGDARVDAVAVGHGKGPRMAVGRLRAALAAAGIRAFVFIVNEAGLSSAANSEPARKELPDRTVPQRCAIGIGRRLQDPLIEILRVDPRHLGLGSEQGLVSKANARRVFQETMESCAAHVGADVNSASAGFLQHLPGIDAATARRIVARRDERPISGREELRQEGLLSEAQWVSSIAFLRVAGGSEPLDATSLHPEQYALVRRLLEAAGTSVEEGLGRPGSTRGLRRADFDVDEATWRDLMREIGHPGRDPRPRLSLPELLDPASDPAQLVKDRVVEGVVSNVASFGAFVDVGLPQDAMIHISECSDRYVRDARELLSIGQVVRARIVEGGGHRLSLSLRNVPREPRFYEQVERPRRGRRPERGESQARPPNVRAAQTRRDGLGAPSGGDRRERRGGRGREGGFDHAGRGPGRGGDRRDERGAEGLPPVQKAPAYSPFASFFKSRKETEEKRPD